MVDKERVGIERREGLYTKWQEAENRDNLAIS